MGQHVQIDNVLGLSGQDVSVVFLLEVLLELVVMEASTCECIPELLLLELLLVEHFRKLFHELVGLSVLAALAQVVVGQHLVEDALVGRLEAAAVVCRTSLLGQVVEADGLRVAHVLHVVGRLHVILHHVCALLVHGLELEVFQLGLLGELQLVKDLLSEHLKVEVPVLRVSDFCGKRSIEHACLEAK